jgi:hypothetical protein
MTGPEQFPIGSRVYLRACAFSVPGVVLRIERAKLVIYWRALDYIGRHRPEFLVLAAEDRDAA